MGMRSMVYRRVTTTPHDGFEFGRVRGTGGKAVFTRGDGAEPARVEADLAPLSCVNRPSGCPTTTGWFGDGVRLGV